MGASPRGSTTTSSVTNALKMKSGIARIIGLHVGRNRPRKPRPRAPARAPTRAQPPRPLERLLAELLFLGPRVAIPNRLRERFDRGRHVCSRQIPDAPRPERKAQGVVDVPQDGDELRRPFDEDQGLQSGGPPRNPLGEAGDLDPRRAAGPHRVRPRAELPLDLSGFGTYTYPLHRGHDQLRAVVVALVETVAQVFDRGGEGEGDGALVRRDRPATGVADQDRKPGRFGLPRGLPEPRQARLRARRPDVGRGGPQQRRGTARAGGHLLEHRLLQPEAVLGGRQADANRDLHGAKIAAQMQEWRREERYRGVRR